MRLKNISRKYWLGGIFGALLSAAVGLVSYFGAIGGGLTRASYDWPFALKPIVPPTEAVLVFIDDSTFKNLGADPILPLDRAFHARLLDQLKAAHAKAVVFDQLYDEPRNQKSDERFAQAIKSFGAVVLCGDYIPVPGKKFDRTVIKPFDSLAEASAGWGLTQLLRDPDYCVRMHRDFVEDFPSLAWTAAEAIGSDVTKKKPENPLRWINYYGPAGTIPFISYYQAIEPNGAPPGFFQDKVVFVGARQSTGSFSEGKDTFGTSYTWLAYEDSSHFSTGTEIHATAFLNLIRHESLRQLSPVIEITLMILIGLSSGFLLTQTRSWIAAAWALIPTILVIALAWILFRYYLIWFSWVIVLVQIATAFAWGIAFNYFQAYIERVVLQRTLEFHLSASRVKQLLKRPELLKPYGEKQEVTLLFSDIAGFSTICERTLPDKLFQQLNQYFSQTISCIHKTDGTVIQLIGDAIFALWNAPEPQADHGERACRAALLLRDAVVKFDETHDFPMRTRVGLHMGTVSVGNLGSADRFDYSAIGANTNLASRLEGLNKHLGTDILISAELMDAVREKFVGRSVGHFKLKGFDRVLEIFELIGLAEEREKNAEWLKKFHEGLRHFKRAEFDAAEKSFQEVAQMHRADGPCKFYQQKIAAYRIHPPAKDWLGEVNMDEK